MRDSPTRDLIIELLRHFPEGLTLKELVAETGLHLQNLRSVIRYSRVKHGSEHLRVLRYELVRGRGGKPQPVYVNGPGPDAKPPKFDSEKNRKTAQARYREKHRARLNAQFRARRGKTPARPFDGLLTLRRGDK